MPNVKNLKVVIYITPICPYCVRAKSLFDKLGVPYTMVDVSNNAALRKEMVDRSGGHTSVPQIFINDRHIGGSHELYNIYQSGKLNSYLSY